MNKFLIILSLLVLALFVIGAGCGGTTTNGGTSGGTTGGTTEWCKAGTTWAWSGTTGGTSTPAAADFKIIGIEQFKGKQYCHAHWTYVEEGETIGEYDWYFIEEDGEIVDAWYLADVQGQTFEYHMTE